MLQSNVSLFYQFNGPKLNEYQFYTASSFIQWIGKLSISNNVYSRTWYTVYESEK